MGPVWMLFAAAALAHEPGLSRVSIDGDAIVLVAARVDVTDPAGLLDGTTVTSDGRPCAIGEARAGVVERDGVEVTAPLDCPDGDVRALTAGWPARMAPGHRALLERGGEPVAVLDAASPSAELATPTAGAVAAAFLWLGIEHIVLGWDHLAFLAALLLVARSFGQAAAIVSGFTVSHSITLSLAALGVVDLPATVVEPAIALTILWVGLENLYHPPPARRFAATLGLGLIHGLGFAGMLAELGMPAEHRLTALLAFNGGVELGQLAIVAVAMPALLWLGKQPRWRERGVPALSVAIALLGLVWLVQRVATAPIE
jgi:hypothetical protein